MRQQLLLGIAIGALTVGGAFAQSPTPPSSNTSKPPAAAPANPSTKAPPEKMQQKPAAKPETNAQKKPETNAQNKSDKATSGSKTTANVGKASTDEPKVVASQKPDQLLASNFTGTDVIGSNGKKIGDVSDILFTKDGTIKAYVVSFGGFLGIGAKEVAIAPSAFEVMPGKEGGAKKLKLAMDLKTLKSAEKFTAYSPPKPTRPASTVGSGATGAPGMSHSSGVK